MALAAFKRENAVPCQSEAGISADSADRRCRLKGLNPGAADLKASDARPPQKKQTNKQTKES